MTDPHPPGTDVLSRRGASLVERPPLPQYIAAHFARAEHAWAPDRPDGYVALCIAENKLMSDTLAERLEAVREVPRHTLGYDAMIGSRWFRDRLAGMMGRTFLGRAVEADQLAVVAGAGSVLELLFHAIADPGDGVLVPTPSYAGFWPDLETRDALRIVPVPALSEDDFALGVDALESALAHADRPVKALLFTNPDNPLGRVASRATIEAILDWADRHGIHVVFDEVYALSVFGDAPFVSAASVRPRLGPRAHVVWAFSKDFGASGLRCGVLVSENEALLRAVDGLAYWSACSGLTQHRLGTAIEDAAWVDAFIAENRARLRSTHARVTAALEAIGVRALPADGGIFVVCDLRPYLAEPTWEAEDALWNRIVTEANVNLTPGSACRVVEPGFFRLCYAAVPTAGVLAGIDRLGRVLGP